MSEPPEPPFAEERMPARDSKGVIAFMASNGVAANLLMIFMLVAGLFSYSRIVQEVFPESGLEIISVSVAYPGASPAEIEQGIVQRIEQAVEAVEGVKTISSVASEGIGTVNVELESGTDIARALDEVKSEVDQIQTFPVEADEPDIRQQTNRQTVLRIALFGEVGERSLKETALALEDKIAALPEVSYVETSSVRDYQILIDVSQDDLRALGLSLPDVSRIVSASSLDSPAGTVDTASDEVRIRTIGQNYSQMDFEDIVLVASEEVDLLRLGDVATITDGFEDSELITRFNDQPVAFVDVYRTSDERVLDVAAAVKQYLAEAYEPPVGVKYAVWDDTSESLEDRLGLLLRNAAIGLVLVLIALTLFLDLRLAFWSAAGIGATFLGAIFILDLAGSSINLFSLFGFILALGLVVDDAVVVSENIYAERERGRSGLGAAIAGTLRVRVPVIFAVATTILSILPLLSIGGVIGKTVVDLPIVMVAVLALSLLEALLVLPHHLSNLPAAGAVAGNKLTRFFERTQKAVDRRFRAFVDGPLDRALRFSVAAPFVVLSGALALLIFMVALVPAGFIKFNFFPDIEGDVVTASIELPAGSSIDRTTLVAEKLRAAGDRALARYQGDEKATDSDLPEFVEAINTSVGSRPTSSGPEGLQEQRGPNYAAVQIALATSRDREVGAAELERAWREELGDLPEVRSLAITSDDLSLGAPITLQLFDADPSVLEAARSRIMNGLEQINGVFEIESDQDAGMPEIELRLTSSARTLGVTLEDVAAQVRAAFFGSEAVRVQRGREDVRVYVRLPDEERNSIADIEQFRIRLPGGFTSLGAIADASFTEAPAQIRREDGRRAVTITANVDDQVVSAEQASQLIDTAVMPTVLADFPTLQYKFGGQQEEQLDNFSGLGTAFGLALLAIYALLAMPFKSYTQPLVIMTAIPFGLIGALFGHILLGLPLGILSLLGVVALSGVIINGSLVMIDFYNENLARGMEPSEAIIAAAKGRFRPIMLTALTTFLGVAPITFETSRQAQFLIPMSASLGFGVLIGTALLMLVIPALAILHTQARSTSLRWLRSMTTNGIAARD